MKRGIALISSAIFLVACSPIKLPPLDSFTINSMQPAAVPKLASSHKTLFIADPGAAPGYNSNAMIYVMTPFKLESYSQNQWVAPPAQMLLPVIADAVRRTNYFSAVITPPFAGNTDYSLDTSLVNLQQEFLLPTSQEHLTMLATLINNSTNRVVATQRFDFQVPAPTNNPYGGVLAANTAAGMLSAKIAAFVTKFAR